MGGWNSKSINYVLKPGKQKNNNKLPKGRDS